MRGYAANAAIHEAVEYIRQWRSIVEEDSYTWNELTHLLDVLGGLEDG